MMRVRFQRTWYDVLAVSLESETIYCLTIVGWVSVSAADVGVRP